jgi:hypothetical protein
MAKALPKRPAWVIIRPAAIRRALFWSFSMVIKVHSSLPAMPTAYEKKAKEEETDMRFKGKSLGVTVTYGGKKTAKCNKINMGKGKDIFIVWEGDDLLIYGWSIEHGKTNKDYKGLFLSKKDGDFSIS